jgi:hypothetical protein
MTNTTHQKTPAVFHNKNSGCTSWVFLLIFAHIFLMQKHQQKQPRDVKKEIQNISTTKKTDDQPMETTGVGDE